MTQTIAPRSVRIPGRCCCRGLLAGPLLGALLAGAARLRARRADRQHPAAGGGGRQGPDAGHADLLRAGRACPTTRCASSTPRASASTRARSGPELQRHDTYGVAAARRAARRHVHRRLAGRLRGQPSRLRRLHLLHRRALQDHRRGLRPGRPAAESSASSTASRATPRTPASSLLVGGAAFVLACWQRGAGVRPLQRLVVPGWLTLTAATLALLLLRGSYTGSGKLGGRLRPRRCSATCCRPRPGAALVSRLLLLARGRAVHRRALRGVRHEAARTTSREARTSPSGSPSAARSSRPGSPRPGRWPSTPRPASRPGLAMPVDVVHLLAVAAWLGGLAALLVALYRAPVDRAARPYGASPRAFGSVVVLVATGLYQSWRQVGSWSALTGTPYGQLLLVKVALVVVLVGIAGSRGAGRRSWRSRGGGRRTEATRKPSEARPRRRVRGGRRPTEPTDARAEKPPRPRTAEARRPTAATRSGPPNSPASRPPWRPRAAEAAARRRPDRAPGCAAPCSPRRASPSSCWPSPPC